MQLQLNKIPNMTYRKTYIISTLLLVLFSVLAAPSAEARKKKRKDVVKEQPAPVKPLSEYEKLFKDKKCQTEKGLFTLHNVEGKLFVEMPLEVMGKDFLIGSTISAITDNRFVSVGEKPRAPMQVFFEKDDKKINMCKRRFDLIADGDEMIEGLKRNTLSGIISSYDIKAYNQDSTAVVIDMTELFLGNTAELNPFPAQNPSSAVQVTQQFKRDLSKLEQIKAFEDNVSIRSRLGYTVTMVNKSKRLAYMTDAPFTVEVTRSIIMLPEKPSHIRYADPRIGVFFQSKSRFADVYEGVKTEYYAKRWRLEPSDSAAYAAGSLVEPKSPVIFYIDNAFPEKWIPHVREGVEVWNDAFERIGFKNVIQTRMFPADDPEFDPDNIRYSCVRYSPSPVANSAGPSWTDPRTGEIINASVYVYHNIVKLLRDWLFIQTSPTDPRVRTLDIPEELMGDCISYVISHEVGHCLGLMHNMAGSSSIPVDSLRSPSFTKRYGTTYSIMDYARFNYIAQPGDVENGVSLMPPTLGEYDYYAIEWLYRPLIGEYDADEERRYFRQFITDRSDNPVYRYGKQQISARVDPSAFEEDLGDDAVKAAEYGIKNLKYICSNMNEWLAPVDYDYSIRQDMQGQIVTQYQRYVTRVLYNIGGIYLNERFEGDKRDSYIPVSKADQKASVKFICDNIHDLKWIDESIQSEGMPLKPQVAPAMGLALFKSLIQRCGSLWYCSPLMGNEPYTQTEFLDQIADFVWKPTKSGKSLNNLQMEIQSSYISYLFSNAAVSTPFPQGKPGHMKFTDDQEDTYTDGLSPEVMGFAPFSGMQGAIPAVKHICFAKLNDSLQLLKKMAYTGNAETRQHYKMLIHSIEKSLDL